MTRYVIPVEIEADTPREAARLLLTMPLQLLMSSPVIDVTDANTGVEYHVDTSKELTK